MKYWLFIMSLSVCSWSLQAQAEKIYQWVDAEGNLQFSQEPPPAGVDASTLELKVPTSGGDVDENAAAPEVPAADAAPKVTDEALKQTLEQLTPEQLRDYNCDKAKENLALLKTSNAPLAKLEDNQDNKQIKLMTPEQREAEVKAAEAQVTNYCSPPQVEKVAPPQAAQQAQ